MNTIYKISKGKYKDIFEPIGEITTIEMEGGATLYFDRGQVKVKKHNNLFYQLYSVAGQQRLKPLRKKVFTGSDCIIFVFNSQRDFTEKNLSALRELKEISNNSIIRRIPLILMANKQDLPNPMKKDEIIKILKQEDLYYEKGHDLFEKNPLIFETCALFEKEKNLIQTLQSVEKFIKH